jgi:hypothetical protein
MRNELEKIDNIHKKLLSISDRLKVYSTAITIYKNKVYKMEDSVQKYILQRELEQMEDFLSKQEMEYKMCRYLYNTYYKVPMV